MGDEATPATVASALASLVERFGPELGEDPRRVGALLRDLAGEHRAEIAAVVAAAEEGVPEDLRTASPHMYAATLQRLVDNLTQNRALAPAAAEQAVSTWAEALGVGPGPAVPPGGATIAVTPVEDAAAPTVAAPEPAQRKGPAWLAGLPIWVVGGAVAAVVIMGVVLIVSQLGGGGGLGDGSVPSTTPGAGGYPPAVVAAFMDRCESEGGDEEICQCTIDEMQEHISLDEFLTIEFDAETAQIGGEIAAECSGIDSTVTIPTSSTSTTSTTTTSSTTTSTTTTTTTTTTLPAFTFVAVAAEDDVIRSEAPSVWQLDARPGGFAVATNIAAWVAEYNQEGWKARVATPGYRASLFPSAEQVDESAMQTILAGVSTPVGCTFAGQEPGTVDGQGASLSYLADLYSCAAGGVYMVVAEWEPAVPNYFIIFEAFWREVRDGDAVDRAFDQLSWTRP